MKHVSLLKMQSFRRSKQGPILLGAFLPGASLPAYSAASSIRGTTETFSYPGVSIVGPTDPSFEGEVRKLFGERASIAEKLAPFLLILKNESPRTIVAYTAAWRIKSADGNEMPLAARYMYPMAISGPVIKGDLPRDREVRMGEERLVSAQFEVGLHINASDVTDQQGRKMPGLTVCAMPYRTGFRGHLVSAVTDKDGAFEIRSSVVGQLQVIAYKDDAGYPMYQEFSSLAE